MVAKAANPFRKYSAEFLSVLVLTLAVSCSIQFESALATPLIAALTVLLFVYGIGPVSGAHINPAVTIGLLSIRKIGLQDAICYVVAQFLGATVGMVIAFALAGGMPYPPVENTPIVAVAEAVGAFLLLFGIAGVVYKKVPAEASGVVIGGSLLLGISTASTVSNGVLNPAVAFGINSFSLAYVLGPIIGAVIGAFAGKYLYE